MQFNHKLKMSRHNIIALLLLSLSLVITVSSAKSNDNGLQERPEKLSQKLEQQRKEFYMPGMAIAIVKNNNVILVKGFGADNLESKSSITDEITIKNEFNGQSMIEIKSIETNLKLDQNIFNLINPESGA